MLKGAIAAAHASKGKSNGKDAAEHNGEALTYFSKALEIDPNDLEAMEYVAHQQRVLGLIDEALESYVQLEKLNTKPETESAIVRTRALRYIGELLEKKFDKTGVQLRLTEAKGKLQAALSAMPAIAKDELDHAFICRGLTSVELKRANGNINYASQQCLVAERIFLDLIRRKRTTSEAEAGRADIRRLRAELDRLQNGGGDAPTANGAGISLPVPKSNGTGSDQPTQT